MIEWKYINSFLRLNVDENVLDVTTSCVSIEQAKWIGHYMQAHSINGVGFGDPFTKCDDISFIIEFPNVTKIGISYLYFNISPIHDLEKLEDIAISFNFKGRINFTSFKHLKRVFINWENAGVESLFECPQMEQVSIMKYGGLSLQDFERLPNLKALFLYEPKSISLEGIGRLQGLERLEISNAKKLKDLGDLENLLSLKKLFLHGAKHLEDLHSVMYLKNLRILNLDSLGKIPSIKFLETLKNLEEFYMAETTDVQDGDLSVLARLRTNHKLDKIIFVNRRHYSHTREQLGYQVPESVAAIFAKKK
jgi:hypothetical protein